MFVSLDKRNDDDIAQILPAVERVECEQFTMAADCWFAMFVRLRRKASELPYLESFNC